MNCHETKPSPDLKAVYERFKHLDGVFRSVTNDQNHFNVAVRDLWIAISDEVTDPSKVMSYQSQRNAAAFKRAQAAHDAEEDPRYWEDETPADSEKKIQRLEDEVFQKEEALNSYRMKTDEALQELRAKVEKTTCFCLINQTSCGRCEASKGLRSLLGMKPEN